MCLIFSWWFHIKYVNFARKSGGAVLPISEWTFSRTVLAHVFIVYTAIMMAPVGSIHQKKRTAKTAAAKPTELVTTSKR
jgi:hypothetical protein